MIIRAADIEPTTWKNGGGQARELLRWPATADADAGADANTNANANASEWRVRISLADITRDGPFSAYPGVTRWFAVVQGAGVELEFANGPQRLGAHDAVLCFDGAAAPGCRLLNGPTRDLNLMLQHGARGEMRRDAHFSENWPLQACFDVDTMALHWPPPAIVPPTPPTPLAAGSGQLWIGVAP